MLQRLIGIFQPWAKAMAGLDDPHGEYLSMLEDRIRGLERETEHLRAQIAANSANCEATAIKAQTDLQVTKRT